MLVTIEEPSTSQDTLSNTADGDGLEPELDASGTETEICNIKEPTATSDSQLVWEAGILLVLRQHFMHEQTFQSLKSVTIAGRLCTVGTVFLRKLPSSNTNAVFFRISEAEVSKRILFIMEEMDTVFFCQQRFCFIVSPENFRFSISEGFGI